MIKPVKCKSERCGKLIYWIEHPTTGKMHPWDSPEMTISHFATCIDSAFFRTRKKSAQKSDRP